MVALDPDALSISGLHNYVTYLKSSGQDPGRYQLNMWSKIFQPLSVAVMMLMALSFIFGPRAAWRWGKGGHRDQLWLYLLRAGPDFWPTDAGLRHPADYRRAAAKRQLLPDKPLADDEKKLAAASPPACREG